MPSILFLILHRFGSSRASRRDRLSVYWTNLAIVAVAVILSATMGFKTYLVIQLAVTTESSTAGVWLSYVRHQFEGVNWQRHEEWDCTAAALEGSSYSCPRFCNGSQATSVFITSII